MRIAFVTFDSPPFAGSTGSGVYAEHVVSELAKLGHETVVFTPRAARDNDEPPKNSIVQIAPVRVTSALRFPAVQFWLKLPHMIKRAEKDNPFDIIHFNGLCYSFVPRRLSNAPHVITVLHPVRDAIEHVNPRLISRIKGLSAETSLIMPHIEKRAMKSTDAVIAISDYTRRRIIETYAIQPRDIHTIHLATDIPESAFSEEQLAEVRSELGVPKVPLVLFVGRVDDRRKGLDQLLYAFRDVLTNQEVSLLVVGSGSQTEARRLAAALNIAKNVFFAGKVEESVLRTCYALCTVYVCPSRLEGFGLPLLEAMAAAKPIVATSVGSIPELVTEQNGSLVDPGDISALANAIRQYLENQELSESIGAYNAMYVRRRFDWKTTALGTEKVYRLVTSQS
jgi:glycosyltransferase involved in cell wall biosynthesis